MLNIIIEKFYYRENYKNEYSLFYFDNKYHFVHNGKQKTRISKKIKEIFKNLIYGSCSKNIFYIEIKVNGLSFTIEGNGLNYNRYEFIDFKLRYLKKLYKIREKIVEEIYKNFQIDTFTPETLKSINNANDIYLISKELYTQKYNLVSNKRNINKYNTDLFRMRIYSPNFPGLRLRCKSRYNYEIVDTSGGLIVDRYKKVMDFLNKINKQCVPLDETKLENFNDKQTKVYKQCINICKRNKKLLPYITNSLKVDVCLEVYSELLNDITKKLTRNMI